MNKLQKILFYEHHLRKLVIVLGILLVVIISSVSNWINYTTENLFRIFAGEKNVDSSIVIIHIDNNDIEQLGGWPLKRSYYALLINKLTQFNVKKIGLEVLLSDKLAFQSIYDDLLKEELLKSNKVVLSSIITNKNKEGEYFGKDTLIYSNPKNDLPQLSSGHLNYILKNGIFVPSVIYINKNKEVAFAVKLADKEFERKNELLKINFYTSWRKFKNFTLLEFFNLIDNETASRYFNNKIVLIGVSDPSIAKTFSTFYDDELPGVGFHAIVLDNLITNRTIKYQSSIFIAVIFLLILYVTSQIKFKVSHTKAIIIVIIAYLITSFILFNNYFIENYYSLVIAPALLLLINEGFIYVLKNKLKIEETSNELLLLKNILITKEQLLSDLIKENEKNKNEDLIGRIEKLKEEIEQLKKYSDEVEESYTENEVKIFEGIVYRSKEMEDVVKLITKIAPSDATVLILGESGSGKELVARAIHNLSNRKEKNFVAVNCAALPESLLESELFGHVKGAFTNAYSDKKGRFEIADGGTIFLDEIAETSENFQAKLLRVIQFGDFEKVGSTETKHVDVRIIAATNKNLDEMVRLKKFREDLFYRLNVLRIEIPPLRKRKNDIEVLANYFAQKEDSSLKISKGVIENLIRNEWKGNVRELESVIKRMVIFAKSENRNIITLKDLPSEYYNIEKDDFENILLNALREKKFSHSSINQTAEEFNLSRTIVSENFRGIFFKTYVNSNYNLEETVKTLASTDDKLVLDKVKAKVSMYLENIKKDLVKFDNSDFTFIKSKMKSKYKNLPVRYHTYFDEIIKHYLAEK
ncbi:sigma 54-interacting transcriptional regulator [Rosettibacter firmus]|uniref:sigma 54-interacting transcriptional regulator n=1 Tax=Rosettibacter firmus TaxID=3111522 RepID=UPI00336C28F0